MKIKRKIVILFKIDFIEIVVESVNGTKKKRNHNENQVIYNLIDESF